ncbi:hypothetical protein MJG53_009548 [Ovis ammon polii x Ovis aries]|uniref:Uncharacterized protein n=1 Tax=Ovis ammon polii x Ovis aries TaxID=2918886 RepID=A0ACB9UX53_9CETA|nr:hypothetical protein MJG53_009548 [Ovis ammon polii x Ovis aries]
MLAMAARWIPFSTKAAKTLGKFWNSLFVLSISQQHSANMQQHISNWHVQQRLEPARQGWLPLPAYSVRGFAFSTPQAGAPLTKGASHDVKIIKTNLPFPRRNPPTLETTVNLLGCRRQGAFKGDRAPAAQSPAGPALPRRLRRVRGEALPFCTSRLSSAVPGARHSLGRTAWRQRRQRKLHGSAWSRALPQPPAPECSAPSPCVDYHRAEMTSASQDEEESNYSSMIMSTPVNLIKLIGESLKMTVTGVKEESFR